MTDKFNDDFIEMQMMEENIEPKPKISKRPISDALVKASSTGQQLEQREIIPQGEPLFKLRYMLTDDENVQGLKYFQQRFMKRKYIIYTVLFSVMAALYLFRLIESPDTSVNYGMFGICIGALFLIWYNPVRQRKSLRKALEYNRGLTHNFDIYENAAVVSAQVPDEEESGFEQPMPTVIGYHDSSAQLIDKEEMLLFVFGKQYFYVLPKRCMTADEQREIISFLNRKLSL